MENRNHCQGLNQALEKYELGQVIACQPYGSGHINDTFLVELQEGGRYILQRMNKDVFKNPPALMENIVKVTSFLKKSIEKSGGDPGRETLNVISTKEGAPWFQDSFGEYWRVYRFIENSVSYDSVSNPRDFYESAVAFGRFQRLLADFPAETLAETIPDFHNTAARFETFRQAVKSDAFRRVKDVEEEINFVLSREPLARVLGEAQAAGQLPLRVTHNDTKLNNIMMDKVTGRGLCVIDLDTVMPGLAVNDFGDSIRFGANTAAEDEQDLSKVSLSLELFDLYAKGFIEGCGGRLTPEEITMLPVGAKVMTFECGMRFLTDYLQGDVYFKTHRPGHNLDRCRTQFALIRDMENKWTQVNEIIKKYTTA